MFELLGPSALSLASLAVSIVFIAMPHQQLTRPTSAIATAASTFNAASATGLAVRSNLAVPAGASTVTTMFVPVNEYWYITGFYLQAGVSVSIANALVRTTVNFVPQRLQPAEAELQQNIYNKIKFSPAQWIQIPGGNQFYQELVTTTTVTTTTTTVTIWETILMAPAKLMP